MSSVLVMSVSKEKIWQMVSLDVLGGVAVGQEMEVLGSGALSPSVEIGVAICSGVLSHVSVFPWSSGTSSSVTTFRRLSCVRGLRRVVDLASG